MNYLFNIGYVIGEDRMSHSEGRRGIGEGQDLVFKRDLAFPVRSFCPIVMKIRTDSSGQIVSSVTKSQSIPASSSDTSPKKQRFWAHFFSPDCQCQE